PTAGGGSPKPWVTGTPVPCKQHGAKEKAAAARSAIKVWPVTREMEVRFDPAAGIPTVVQIPRAAGEMAPPVEADQFDQPLLLGGRRHAAELLPAQLLRSLSYRPRRRTLASQLPELPDRRVIRP